MHLYHLVFLRSRWPRDQFLAVRSKNKVHAEALRSRASYLPSVYFEAEAAWFLSNLSRLRNTETLSKRLMVQRLKVVSTRCGVFLSTMFRPIYVAAR